MGNARINITVMNTEVETWARELSNIAKGKGIGQTDTSIKLEKELKLFVQNSPPGRKKKMLNHLLKRFQIEGDDFRRISGFGQYNELVAGIVLGIFDEDDIDNYKVYDGIAFWKEGDIVSIEAARNAPVHHQVKGAGGGLQPQGTRKGDTWDYGSGISLNKNIGFKKDDFTSQGFFNHSMSESRKKFLVYRALDEYIKESPTDIRIVSPIYPNAVKGVFDIGADTFKMMAFQYPEAFRFAIPSDRSRPYIAHDMSVEQALVAIKKDIDKGEYSLTRDLDKAFNENWLKEAGLTLDEFLRKLLWVRRIDFWEGYGQLFFKYDGPTLANAAFPLINTGIERHENPTPFYNLLLNLYGQQGGSAKHRLPQVSYYLSYNGNTAENKQPDYFYNHQYHDIRY